ncbi:MAG: antibiotic biosynthesis monooxygenase [Halobacteriales archaeon]|nr:antibiotic biosynthesis monooxygenase [Halobacteriales archaeon]
MYVVENRLSVVEEFEEDFIERFETQFEQIRQQDGLERVELLIPKESDHYVIKAYWDSQDAFERWRHSEAFQRAHEDIPEEMFTEPNQLNTYEQVLMVSSDR